MVAVKDYARVTVGRDVYGRNVVINGRTQAMMAEVNRMLGHTLSYGQGSYMAGGGAKASAGTHDFGGVVDIATSDLKAMGISVQQVVLAMRRVGFAAWHRGPWQDPSFPDHIHAVALSDHELSSSAASQERSYRAGRNGLLANLPDDGPRIKIVTWEQYRRAQRTVSAAALITAARVDRTRPLGSRPRQTRLVQKALGMRLCTGRWGPWTRKAYAARFPGSHGLPTVATLQQLSAGKFRLVP